MGTVLVDKGTDVGNIRPLVNENRPHGKSMNEQYVNK